MIDFEEIRQKIKADIKTGEADKRCDYQHSDFIGGWRTSYSVVKEELKLEKSSGFVDDRCEEPGYQTVYHHSFGNSDEMLDFAVRVIQVIQMDLILKKMPKISFRS